MTLKKNTFYLYSGLIDFVNNNNVKVVSIVQIEDGYWRLFYYDDSNENIITDNE